MAIEETLREILQKTFKNSELPNEISTLSIGDLEEWDSLGNFNLILAVESHYQIQFDMNELETLNSIALLQKAIMNALSK
jgi:acyl carrier protein